MARRRIRPRMPRGAGEWAAAGIVALAVATALVRAVVVAGHAAMRVWPVPAALAAAAMLYSVWRLVRASRAARVRTASLSRLQITLSSIDAMNDQEFEFVLADLLVRDGWTADRVGRQGDQAADVIGRHHRHGKIVIQAKHTKVAGKVGSHVMYEVNGTAGPVHRADAAVVVTNGTFTRDARTWGDRHHVYWIDRDRLQAWAAAGTPLHDLLRLPRRPQRSAVPRRPPRLRSRIS
ncbi:restriction system protein [Streptomyces sp. V4I23]|nr:restriction system protein [Streptomyces sp. V4I23]